MPHTKTDVLPPPERRQHTRMPGDCYPLRVARQSARLMDWSAGGIGVMVRDGVDDFALGQAVSVSIHSEQTMAVMVFHGRVQRIDVDARIVGIMFDLGGEEVVSLLVDLVGDAVRANDAACGEVPARSPDV
jgi:hypothetical protein